MFSKLLSLIYDHLLVLISSGVLKGVVLGRSFLLNCKNFSFIIFKLFNILKLPQYRLL